MKMPISVVVTDLDNTLFDWVDVWHSSFKAMLDRLVLDSGIPEGILIPEFKIIHEKHGTAEYAFSIQELPSLKKKYPGEDLASRFGEAIHAYRSARNSALLLYPTVEESLETLKDNGCLLIGYTESMSFYTGRRIRKLGLDRILDYIYSPPDHGLPGGLAPEEIRHYPEEHYQLRRTVHRLIRKGELKPDPHVLLDIIRGVGATAADTIYVGDSLMKDVSMAQKAGVTDVWARYGLAHDRGEYELLRKVTHWTAADVEREKKLRAEDIRPSHVLESSFGDILEQFEFSPFLNKSIEHISVVVDVWKKTVDVQQHFNDLELRIRNYALTIFAAMLSFAAYAIKESLDVVVWGHAFSVAASLLFSSVLLWLAFYFMDRFWYHKLLYGAVDRGRFIENRWSRVLPELSLTESIGRYSPLRLFGLELHTPQKIDLFYGVGAIFLLALGTLAQFTVRPQDRPTSQDKPRQTSLPSPAVHDSASPAARVAPNPLATPSSNNPAQ